MSSTELAANLFRITQTDEVLKNKNINNEDDACIAHHKVGQAVRQTIKRIGGTMPEEMNNLNIKNLLLWHCIDNNIEMRKELFTKEAKEYFYGNVYVPDDLDEIEL